MIQVRNLYKYYGAKRALGPVSFDIREREIVGFLGLNGAGKTTALRVLACDLLPSAGAVWVDGEDVTEASLALRARVGFLPERVPLYQEMTVREYLTFAGRLRGIARGEIGQTVGVTLKQTAIEDVAEEMCGNLSYGYQKRVGIAQAIIHRPKLLILDDPFTGLDPVQIVEMRTMVRGLLGVQTILVSSHLLSEISEICDRILVIREGEIVASGTEHELSGRFLRGQRLDVEVRGAREAALSVAGRVAGVTSVSCEIERDGVCHLAVQTEQDVRAELCKALVDAGLGVLRLDRGARELESVFLRLAHGAGNGSPAADASAPGATEQPGAGAAGAAAEPAKTTEG